MPTMTLDDIKARTEKRYEPLRIELGDKGYVEFRQALRMTQTERSELMRMQKEFNSIREVAENTDESDVTPEDAERIENETRDGLEKMLRLIASNDHYADLYFEAVEHDIATLMETFRTYQDDSEMGEASASPAS